MSQKLKTVYRLQIVLSACVLSLGCSLVPRITMAEGPAYTYSHVNPTAYYAQTITPIVPPPADTYVPHELVIHFAPGYAPHELEAQIAAETQKSRTLFGRMRGFVMNFFRRTSPSPLEDAVEHVTRITALDEQFGALEKTRMFDEDDQNMSNVYIVRFSENTDLENARIAYENLEEVSYVQYNFIYSLQ